MTFAHIRTVYVPLLLDLKTLGISLNCDNNGALVALDLETQGHYGHFMH